MHEENDAHDTSDMINDTMEMETPTIKEADLRRSLTRSYKDILVGNNNLASYNNNKIQANRPSYEESKGFQQNKASPNFFKNDYSQEQRSNNDHLGDNQNVDVSATEIDRFADLEVPKNFSKRKQTASATINMLKLYQNANQNVSRQVRNPHPTKGQEIRAEEINDTTITQNFEDIKVPGMGNNSDGLLLGEENILEQTIGQTLTQQKKILDQIQQQTENRNHMQLMNRYLDDRDSFQESQIKQLS